MTWLLVENLSCINASSTNVSCMDSCFYNWSLNHILNHVNPVTFAYIANLTSDAQQEFNDLSLCLSNVLLNYWKTTASVNYDNVVCTIFLQIIGLVMH